MNTISKLLERRTTYANALNKSLEIFVSCTEKSINDVISNGLRPIADVADLDRIIIFRIYRLENNTAGEIYRWDKMLGGTVPVDPTLKVLPVTTALKRWISIVSDDTCINLQRSKFTEDEAAFLSPRGTQSILIVPVFTESELWGVVTFHDNINERDFDEDCTSLLRSAARLCASTLIRDEMQRKITENGIHIEKEKYRTMAHWYESLLDALPFLVTSQDLDMKCTFINAVAETSFGKNRAEIVGGCCNNLKLSICDTENCAIVCAKRGRMRTHFLHENDSYQVDTKVLKDLNGKPTGYIEVIQDITKMEHLAKQQAEAEAASNAKTSFLSAMSHEMRTPMNAIIGMASIGKNATDLERKNHALNKIEDASRHLLDVINDILDMSKIEANKLELSQIAFDLNNSICKAISFVQFSTEEKMLNFSMNIHDNTPFFLIGDDLRLTQVITNLLSNAVKFTPKEGNISLEVSLADEKDGICELLFEVADNGIGITSEQKEKIFHPFEQAESGTTRKYGGTGLGLVISKNIIELMGGKIWVESEPGKGARFIFTVKLSRDTNDSRRQFHLDRNNEISVESIYDKTRGKKLLLVEDMEINREILISLLDGTGLVIDTAVNGKEAIDMVTADPDKYDLIFMDVQMPEIDGLEATRQIRTLEQQLAAKKAELLPGRTKGVPIVAMTANVFQEDIDKCHVAGMDDHIGKPLDPGKLLEKLREYL